MLKGFEMVVVKENVEIAIVMISTGLTVIYGLAGNYDMLSIEK